MANPSRDKGTRNENRIRDTWLKPIWPDAERQALKGINDYGDFINVPWLIEAKWRKKLGGEIFKWAETARVKANWNEGHHGLPKDSLPWAVVFTQDKRTEMGLDLVRTTD